MHCESFHHRNVQHSDCIWHVFRISCSPHRNIITRISKRRLFSGCLPIISQHRMFQFTRGTSCSRLSCEQLIANKCDQSVRCLIMDLEFGVWCPLKLCRLWFGLGLPVSEARSSENNPFFSWRVVLSARRNILT